MTDSAGSFKKELVSVTTQKGKFWHSMRLGIATSKSGMPCPYRVKSARLDGRNPRCNRHWHSPIGLGKILFLSVVVSSSFVAAHPDLLDQIQVVTEQLVKEPTKAELYLKRGELYRHHRDWKSALKDYEEASKLDPELSRVALARGRMWLDAGQPKSAELSLKSFLAKNPSHAKALVLHGRALVQQGQSCAASNDFTRAIELLPTPIPDFYLERARALSSCGGEYIDEAIKGLDNGMKRLGPLVTLQTLAIDLELSRHYYDAALTRLQQIERQAGRKEKWLLRRGEILAQAGRMDDSLEAFRQALAAIQSLPERHRTTKRTKDLESRLQTLLEKTDKE